MRLLFVFGMLFGLVESPAQQQTIDSLTILVDSHALNDSTKISLMNALSRSYKETNPDSSIEIGNRALVLSRSLESLNQEAWALINIGTGYWMKGQFPDALRYSQDAMVLFETLGDKEGIAQSYNSIANTHNMQGTHIKSLEYYKKSIGIYTELGDDYNVGRALANMGRTYFMLGEYDSALEYLGDVTQMTENEPHTILYPIVLNTTGDVHQALANYDEALTFYFGALRSAESLQIPRIITYSTRGISEVYQIQNKLEESNLFAKRTLEISKEIGYQENVKNAALILSDNFRKRNDFVKAYEFYVEYAVTKDSMFSEEKAKELQKLQESYEILQRQKEIQLLKAENELQEVASGRQKELLYVLIVVTSLIVLLVIVLYRRVQLKQRTNRLLSIQKENLAKSREELFQHSVQLKEVNTMKDKLFSIISHDLRSPFTSLLSVIALLDRKELSPRELESVKNNLLTKTESILEMLDNLLIWARTQLKGIKVQKTRIDLPNLVSKTIMLFDSFAKNKNITIKNEVGENIDVYADKDQLRVVVRNLLNNAIKFTNEAGEITIGTESAEGMLEVWIRDNGVGMSEEVVSKIFDSANMVSTKGTNDELGTGLGLSLCKEFVVSNGGTIWVESESNIGSTFSFTLPTR